MVWPLVQEGVEQGWQPWDDLFEYVFSGQREQDDAPGSDVNPEGHGVASGDILMYWTWLTSSRLSGNGTA
jgi:hypothetical protein